MVVSVHLRVSRCVYMYVCMYVRVCLPVLRVVINVNFPQRKSTFMSCFMYRSNIFSVLLNTLNADACQTHVRLCASGL